MFVLGGIKMNNIINGFGQVGEIVKNVAPGLEDTIGVAMEFTPYVGSILQARKLNRFKSRIEDNEQQIREISALFGYSKMSREFINERIAPIVFADIIEEHEDAKINLILTGFQNVFLDENSNESMIINYFDTLRELRYEDIKRLFYLVKRMDSYPLREYDTEEYAHLRYMDMKLERMGLVFIEKRVGELQYEEYETERGKVKTSMYGKRFLKFICEKEEQNNEAE